jgi:hypothetical protein
MATAMKKSRRNTLDARGIKKPKGVSARQFNRTMRDIAGAGGQAAELLTPG